MFEKIASGRDSVTTSFTYIHNLVITTLNSGFQKYRFCYDENESSERIHGTCVTSINSFKRKHLDIYQMLGKKL